MWDFMSRRRREESYPATLRIATSRRCPSIETIFRSRRVLSCPRWRHSIRRKWLRGDFLRPRCAKIHLHGRIRGSRSSTPLISCMHSFEKWCARRSSSPLCRAEYLSSTISWNFRAKMNLSLAWLPFISGYPSRMPGRDCGVVLRSLAHVIEALMV